MCITIVKPTKVKEHDELTRERMEVLKDIAVVYKAKWCWEDVRESSREAAAMLRAIDRELYLLHVKSVLIDGQIRECEVRIG